MRGRPFAGLMAALFLANLSMTGTVFAASCRTTGSFDSWLAEFKREALAQGISQRAIAAASPGLVFDQRIVNIGVVHFAVYAPGSSIVA